MTETERDRLIKLELTVAHLRDDIASLDRKNDEQSKRVEELTSTVALLSATITALRRVLWLIAGAIVSEVGAIIIAFIFKGGLSVGVGA